MKNKTCSLCHRTFAEHSLFPIDLLKPGIQELIAQHHVFSSKSFICPEDLTEFYKKWRKQQILESAHICNLSEIGLKSFDESLLNAKSFDELEDGRLTMGERLSDHLTSFGGSWAFILSFFIFLFLWMAWNSYLWITDAFDPYPYILLNLVLSCLAAIQAPVILMSQKRQEARDRLRAELDYHINLQAGLEIRDISAKVDHIGKTLWEHLLEIEKTLEKRSDKKTLEK